jgi:hypothetical protein
MEHAENYQRPYPPTQNSQQYQRSGNNRNQNEQRREPHLYPELAYLPLIISILANTYFL